MQEKVELCNGLVIEKWLSAERKTWIKVSTPHVEITDIADRFDYFARGIFYQNVKLLLTREQAAEFFMFIDGRLPDNWNEE